MEPTVMTGDFIIAQEVKTSSLKPGDVIIFQPCISGTGKTLHRLVTIQKSANGVIIETKGDHNNGKDPWKCEVTAKTTPKLKWNLEIPLTNTLIPVKHS